MLEREKNCAAIECYSDSPKEVENLIQQSLSNEKISIEPEALRHLSHMLGVDRLTTRSEISKLLTYTYGQTRIELCDIENIVANAATIATESIINDAFSGRVEELDKNLARALASGIDTNFLYSSILRYAIALHRSLTEFRAGVAIDQLIFGMSRQGIFIKKEPLQEQIRLWTVERLTATLSEILDASNKARRETKISEILAVRTLWSIARAANSKRVSSSLKTSA